MHPEYSKSVLLVTASDLEEALIAELGLELLRRSQLGQIISELASSVVAAAESDLKKRRRKQYFPDQFVTEETARIKKFVVMLPSAFHHHSFEAGTRRIALFDQPLKQFMLSAETVKNEPVSRLQNAYGTLWMHANVLDAVRSGEKASIHREHYLHADPAQLEQVARTYLRAPDFVSPLLEWALVDALLWSRIQHFASSRAPTVARLARLAASHGDGPLVLAAPPVVKEGWHQANFVKLATTGLIELAALALTYGIATLATAQTTDKWLLFTGVTAARWVVTALRSNRNRLPEPATEADATLQLLWQLCQAHARVPGMNVGLLRHLVYQLEEQGAAISATVLDLLDKRGLR